jgi:hypothetical protein
MDLDLIKWLNMVWGALEEPDSDKRANLLVNANSFLEQTRSLAADATPMPRSTTPILQTDPARLAL